MNARQARLFRHVLKTTGCLAAALRAAGLRPRKPGGLRGNACQCRPAPGGVGQTVLHNTPAQPDQAAAALESEAVRRALSGVTLPVYHQGRQCGSTVKHSDQLLMFLLKALRPGRYGAERDGGHASAAPTLLLEVDLSAGQAAEAPED